MARVSRLKYTADVERRRRRRFLLCKKDSYRRSEVDDENPIV